MRYDRTHFDLLSDRYCPRIPLLNHFSSSEGGQKHLTLCSEKHENCSDVFGYIRKETLVILTETEEKMDLKLSESNFAVLSRFIEFMHTTKAENSKLTILKRILATYLSQHLKHLCGLQEKFYSVHSTFKTSLNNVKLN
jgi:hypothetical protein